MMRIDVLKEKSHTLASRDLYRYYLVRFDEFVGYWLSLTHCFMEHLKINISNDGFSKSTKNKIVIIIIYF